MTVDEMRAELDLGPEVSDAAVVDAYAAFTSQDVEDLEIELITLEEAKAHLRVLHDDEDALIASKLAGAIAFIDGPDGWLGRSITPQTIVKRLDAFPGAPLYLSYPPLLSVTAIEYRVEGAWQAVPADTYEIDDGHVQLAYGKSWPSGSFGGGGVRITYRAGYLSIPHGLRAAVLLMMGELYQYRVPVGDGSYSEIPMSTAVGHLLRPFRVWI